MHLKRSGFSFLFFIYKYKCLCMSVRIHFKNSIQWQFDSVYKLCIVEIDLCTQTTIRCNQRYKFAHMYYKLGINEAFYSQSFIAMECSISIEYDDPCKLFFVLCCVVLHAMFLVHSVNIFHVQKHTRTQIR